MTLEQIAQLPLIGLPAHRAFRTLPGISTSTAIPSSRQSDDSDSDRRSSRNNAKRRTALVLNAHDGPGALLVQLLSAHGVLVTAHVPGAEAFSAKGLGIGLSGKRDAALSPKASSKQTPDDNVTRAQPSDQAKRIELGHYRSKSAPALGDRDSSRFSRSPQDSSESSASSTSSSEDAPAGVASDNGISSQASTDDSRSENRTSSSDGSSTDDEEHGDVRTQAAHRRDSGSSSSSSDSASSNHDDEEGRDEDEEEEQDITASRMHSSSSQSGTTSLTHSSAASASSNSSSSVSETSSVASSIAAAQEAPTNPYETRVKQLFGASHVIAGDALRIMSTLASGTHPCPTGGPCQFDYVLDTVGGRRMWEAARWILKPGGQFTTLIGDDPCSPPYALAPKLKTNLRSMIRRDKCSYEYVLPNAELDTEGEDVRDALGAVKDLVESGTLAFGPWCGRRGGTEEQRRERSTFHPRNDGDEREREGAFANHAEEDDAHDPCVVRLDQVPEAVFGAEGRAHLADGGVMVARLLGF